MRSTLLAALVVAAAVPSSAATLSALVHTADGRPLSQVSLSLAGPSVDRTVLTGPDGRVRVPNLGEGAYTLEVDTPGLEGSARIELGTADATVDVAVTASPIEEQVVVTATRAETPASNLGVSADALDGDRIADAESTDLLHLLPRLTGVSVARAGGLGQQSSAFVRGGNSNSTRLLVDGVPVNEPGGAYDLGGLLPLATERVEIVRGAASSLYGTDALAGAINLVTRRAALGERPSVQAEAEGGELAWRRGLLGTTGRQGAFDWSAAAQRVETDNDQPNSRFEENAGALSLGLAIDGRTDARAVLRVADSTTGTPGQVAFGQLDLDASFERQTLVTGVQVQRRAARGVHALSLGWAQNHQLSKNPIDSGSWVPTYQGQESAFGAFSDFTDPLGLQNDTERLSAGYKLEQPLGTGHILTTGLDVERETGALGSLSFLPLLEPKRTNAGVYAQDQAVIARRVFATFGARLEHNASFGTKVVPRAAVAVRVRDGADATTVRASAGLGIKEPSFFESFGVSFYALGNPDLKPERSRTVDFGLEQRLLGGRLRAGATGFYHSYLDQVAYHVVDFNSGQGTFVNLGETRAQGLELSVEAAPNAHLTLHGAYTLTDSKVVVSTSDFDPVFAVDAALLRRPKHQGVLEAEGHAGRVSGGASVLFVGERADSDFAGLGLTTNPGHTRLDARLRVQLVRQVELFTAAENVLDEEYMDVLGYPAPGRVVRFGVRLDTGAGRP